MAQRFTEIIKQEFRESLRSLHTMSTRLHASLRALTPVFVQNGLDLLIGDG